MCRNSSMPSRRCRPVWLVFYASLIRYSDSLQQSIHIEKQKSCALSSVRSRISPGYVRRRNRLAFVNRCHSRRRGLHRSHVDSNCDSAYPTEIQDAINDPWPESPPPSPPSPLRYAVLLSVPLVWGTYAPAVRFLYDQPISMPGILFSAIYYIIALATLIIVSGAITLSRGEIKGDLDAGSAEEAVDAFKEDRVWAAGGELGAYLFFGNFFQVLGLQWTTVDRAAFIVQLTTVIVPCLEASVLFANKPLSARTWIGCLLAAVGVLVLSSESVDQISPGALSVDTSIYSLFQGAQGDALVAVAALFYSIHVIRLGSIAPNVPPLRLAVAKACFETLYALATLILIAVCSTTGLSSGFPLLPEQNGGWLAAHFPPAEDMEVFAAAVAGGAVPGSEWNAIASAALWCGVMTCAYTIWAQSFGQRDVRPADANLIYTSQPIFSAAIAALWLGETLTPQGLVGGGIIIVALLVSIAPSISA